MIDDVTTGASLAGVQTMPSPSGGGNYSCSCDCWCLCFCVPFGWMSPNNWNGPAQGPLLNLDLMKRCCDFVNSRARGTDVHFSVTTNGTLLTGEALEFLARNNVAVSISLDGPNEIHDRYRVYPDGRGTFETVFRNARRIYDEHRRHFDERILFNCTVTPTANLKLLDERVHKCNGFEHMQELLGRADV